MLTWDDIKQDVIFIKHHTLQPTWWKITKTILLLGASIVVVWIYDIAKAMLWLFIVMLLSLGLHFIYRYKTKVYTKPWMDFKVKAMDGKLIYQRIGWLYYTCVFIIIATATSVIVLI